MAGLLSDTLPRHASKPASESTASSSPVLWTSRIKVRLLAAASCCLTAHLANGAAKIKLCRLAGLLPRGTCANVGGYPARRSAQDRARCASVILTVHHRSPLHPQLTMAPVNRRTQALGRVLLRARKASPLFDVYAVAATPIPEIPRLIRLTLPNPNRMRDRTDGHRNKEQEPHTQHRPGLCHHFCLLQRLQVVVIDRGWRLRRAGALAWRQRQRRW